MPLRVLYVSPLPPPPGGISVWMRILLEQGLPGGHVAAVVDTARRSGESAAPPQLRRTWRILREFRSALDRERPDLVHINVAPLDRGPLRDLALAWLAARRGVPVVVHHHGPVARLAEPGTPRLRRRVLHRLARRARANLVLDRSAQTHLEQAGAAAVHVLPNYYDPVALDRFAGAAPPPGRPRVAFVGDLIPAKGLAEVIAVARQLPEADFHLYGRRLDPGAPLLSQPLPDNCHVHGSVETDVVLAALAESRLLLLPSRSEGFPLAVCEAMALGLPVVASPVGAIPEMLDGERGGRLVDPGDVAGLTDAVRELLADEPLRRQLGEHNRARARAEYRYDGVAERLAAIYEGVVAKAEPRPA